MSPTTKIPSMCWLAVLTKTAWITQTAPVAKAIPPKPPGPMTSGKGESVSSLIKNPPPGAPVPPILPPQDGFLFLDRTEFRASFAADVSADVAAFMADSQVPWGLEALNGAVSEPAWKSKPSWYLVSTEDRMIPPDAQRAMSKRAGSTVAEVKGSHAVYVSQPDAVAAIIAKAAHGVALAAR